MAAESFSDEELRRELTSRGFSVGPITESTRKVLLRKLNNLRNGNSHLSSNRTTISSKRASPGRVSMPPINSGSPNFSLNSFSSDESEPDDNHNDSVSFSDDLNATTQSSSKLSHAPSSRVTLDSNNYDTARRSIVDTSTLARPSIRSYANGPSYGSGTDLSAKKFDLEWRRLHSFKVGQSEAPRTPINNNLVKRMFDWHHTWQVVSSVLIVLVLIFAVVVIASYVYIARVPQKMSSSYSVCSSATDDVDDMNCAVSNEKHIEKQLVDSLLESLINRAGAYDCGNAVSRRMSKGEVETFIENRLSNIHSVSDITVDDWRKKVYCLLNKNSDWGIKLLNENGETILECDSNNIQFLESQIGRKTLWCRLMLSVRTVFAAIAAVLALVTMGVTITLIVRQRQKWAEAEQQEVFDLVEKIVDVLKQNADAVEPAKQDSKESSLTPYLAIAHVRDALIPLHLRQKRQAIWDKAVRFLSANESRVRTENQKISGEDFVVWRWIQPTVEGPKVWQGQAFGGDGEATAGIRPRHRSSVPITPLTTCLKIRNMFDLSLESGVEWQKPVEDAVLDKCVGAAIVHIAVDTTSADGCIYVRCRDLESAGVTFKALHGWWFDGRLVTVKYLREQRYEERYPASRNTTVSLQASSKERLSLSRPFHSSIIENS